MALNKNQVFEGGIEFVGDDNVGLTLKNYTTAARDLLVNPPDGGLILNTTTGTLNYFDGTSWVEVKNQDNSGDSFTLTKSTINENINVAGIVDIGWDVNTQINSSTFSHSTTVNPPEVTILRDGVYQISASLYIDTFLTNRFVASMFLYINNVESGFLSGYAYSRGDTRGDIISYNFSGAIPLTANDIIKVVTFRELNQGGANVIVENGSSFTGTLIKET